MKEPPIDMTLSLRIIWLLPLSLLLLSCRAQPATLNAPQPAPTQLPGSNTVQPLAAQLSTQTPPATQMAVPTEAPTEPVVPTSTPTPALLPTVTVIPTATPTPDPYAAYGIEALAARSYGGGSLQLIERLENNETFARYLISYPSDGLEIHGFMNVPHEGAKFPVAIVLHGYVDPDAYQTLAYTTRYADALAEAGYLVIHPNLRGFPPSDAGEDAFRSGLAVDVLNLIAIIREKSSDPEGPLRRADAESLHLWGHSMGGGVTLRVATVLGQPYLRAAVLYGAMSGDEKQNYEKIFQWSDGRSGEFELAAPPESLAAISPINHLDRIQAPISIHHGEADETVPAAWSADLCARLQERDHPVECFTYNAAPHTFYGAWEELFNERVIDFFDRY